MDIVDRPDRGPQVAAGGFAPDLASNEEAIELVVEAIERAGYTAGKDLYIALDPAATEMYQDGRYVFYKSDADRRLTGEEMAAYRLKLAAR